MRVSYLRDEFLHAAVGAAIFGALSVGLLVWVLDHDGTDLWIGGLLGAVLYGVLRFHMDVSAKLPGQAPPRLPLDARIEPAFGHLRHQLVFLAILVPVVLGVAWLADEFDHVGLVIPGAFLGDFGASLTGAVLVVAWERRHRARLLIEEGEEEEDEPALYQATAAHAAVASVPRPG